MAHRFTVTDKWAKPWFMQLSPYAKLLFLYLADECDLAGIWEINIPMASLQTGLTSSQVERAENELTTEYAGERKVIRGPRHLWLVKFIKHQRNLPLNPENRAHMGIIASLEKHSPEFGFDLRKSFENNNLPSPLQAPSKPLLRGYGIGNGIGNGVRGVGEGGHDTSREFDEEFWPHVPVKTDKKLAREQWVAKRKTVAKETILSGLDAYRAKERARATKPDYQAHSPFRWLRDERWTDELRGPPRSPENTLCACGCGKPARTEAAGKWFASRECRRKELGW
jgi:hypothetical protein